MSHTKAAPADTGATSQQDGLETEASVARESTTSAGPWAASAVRVAGVEAEQRALAGFERIADAMPEVAARLTAELLPDAPPVEVIARRQP